MLVGLQNPIKLGKLASLKLSNVIHIITLSLPFG